MAAPQETYVGSTTIKNRIKSIDALRGLVIVIMMLDHIRDGFFQHVPLTDPVDVVSTSVSMFLLRLLSSFCAPIFVFLTGVSIYLYSLSHSRREVSNYLYKRGLVLILLELTVINIAWTGDIFPSKLYLQVIWVIGLCMLLMPTMLLLPRTLQWIVALLMIVGHNLLDSISLNVGDSFEYIWFILRQREWISISESVSVRTSYPLIPWPGVMMLGYLLGAFYSSTVTVEERKVKLFYWGLSLLLIFLVLRFLNVYGDIPWVASGSTQANLMNFFALTKYPPSLFFILFTLSFGCLMLAWFEDNQIRKWTMPLVHFGSAPMFFYITHLYMLGIVYLSCVAIFGKTQGKYFGFEHLGWLWITFLLSMPILYLTTRWFGNLKQRRRDICWLAYF